MNEYTQNAAPLSPTFTSPFLYVYIQVPVILPVAFPAPEYLNIQSSNMWHLGKHDS